MAKTAVFHRLESKVRSYCRDIPVVFQNAVGHTLTDESGAEYIDFLSGAGALNYGHNNPVLKERVIAYIRDNGITHSLDLHTAAKRRFLECLQEIVLAPRGLEYRVQFTGPTGTNAVEAAMKLARLVTGRRNIIAFTNAFHGMSLGSLSATGLQQKRRGGGIPFVGIDRMPFDGYLGANVDTLKYLEKALDDPGSGIDPPAAFIVETLQAEGGLNLAGKAWLQGLQDLAHRHGALLIVDEIQTGCGRTGPFFSFERANLKPDIVCLAKSIGGYGLPCAIVLLRPEIDQWEPGQHNGTFRGNNLAFVAGAAALEFWRDPEFEASIHRKAAGLHHRLAAIARDACLGEATVRGLGLLQGLKWRDRDVARRVAARAFDAGVVIETCGPHDEVLKFMPPLTIPAAALAEGLDRVERVIAEETGALPVIRAAS